MRRLQAGAKWCLAGRCYDPANFAALPIMLGYDPGLALHLGKILECGAIAATPGSGADCVLGTLAATRFVLESLNPQAALHAGSRPPPTRSTRNPIPIIFPDPAGCWTWKTASFTDLGDGRVEVQGSRHRATPPYCVKLEGARKTGCRAISIAGMRDPQMIAGIDAILAAVQERRHDRHDRAASSISTSTARTA